MENKIKLSDKEKALIDKLEHDTYTSEYIEHWVNRNDNVFINAPAALSAIGAKGYYAAIRAMVKLINQSESKIRTARIDEVGNSVCEKAIAEVFTSSAVVSENFDALCYHQMLDDSHSIVIHGGEDFGKRYYIILIREGATESDWKGKKEFCGGYTQNASYKELQVGIKRQLSQLYKGTKQLSVLFD